MQTHAQTVDRFKAIISDITVERSRQDLLFGEQNHTPAQWMMILQEELGEFARGVLEGTSPAKTREELVQVAAVVVAMLESWDRNQGR